MTNEQILKAATIARETADNYHAVKALDDIIAHACAEIGKSAAKSINNVNAYKAALRFAKALHSAKDIRNGMRGAINIDGGKQYLCDGISAIAYHEHFSGLPEATGEHPNFTEIFDNAATHELQLDIPSLAELKAELKQRKATGEGKKIIKRLDQHGFKIGVNLEFLVRVIELLGNNISDVYCKQPNNDKLTSPLFFEANIGDAILLPIRIQEA